MKKHILISGEKGVGKSTLIRRLLEAADMQIFTQRWTKAQRK